MAVAFGGIETETLQHVNAHFFLIGKLRMLFKGGNQFISADVATFVIEADIPRLMVDAGADNVQFQVVRNTERFGNLPPAILNAVAQANGVNLAMIEASPSIHRHGVGIVEMQQI